jgi:hypothetical protein
MLARKRFLMTLVLPFLFLAHAPTLQALDTEGPPTPLDRESAPSSRFLRTPP